MRVTSDVHASIWLSIQSVYMLLSATTLFWRVALVVYTLAAKFVVIFVP